MFCCCGVPVWFKAADSTRRLHCTGLLLCSSMMSPDWLAWQKITPSSHPIHSILFALLPPLLLLVCAYSLFWSIQQKLWINNIYCVILPSISSLEMAIKRYYWMLVIFFLIYRWSEKPRTLKAEFNDQEWHQQRVSILSPCQREAPNSTCL